MMNDDEFDNNFAFKRVKTIYSWLLIDSCITLEYYHYKTYDAIKIKNLNNEGRKIVSH